MTQSDIESTEQAITFLQDTSQSEIERERAVHYLQENASPEGIEALVAGLEDDDYGVHWACGSASAGLGERAFPTLLLALAKPDHSPRSREGTRHVVHYNSSTKVKAESEELMRAIKGPAAAIATMEAAYHLMEKFN